MEIKQLQALGMLSNLSIGLAIDAYGPDVWQCRRYCWNVRMLPKGVRIITDALDAASNTTAAIGKGFAIGSACLVSLALLGALLATRVKLQAD